MKPRSVWKKWTEGGRRGEKPKKYFNDPYELDLIYAYCRQDVEAEYELDCALPDLPKFERKVWLLNQHQNLHGVRVDKPVVERICKMVTEETETQLKIAHDLTGLNVTQRDKILKWVRKKGAPMPNMRAATVEEHLGSNETPKNVKAVLRARQTLSKTSTKKYWAMLDRAGDDNRVRDLSMYWGAGPGREAGTGLQLQNLPKGIYGLDTNEAIEDIKSHDLAFLKVLYGDPMALFSSCIRGMVTASPGHQLYVADYNAIECRVLNWIAGNSWVLDEFKKGRDPYLIMAAALDSDDRQFGKTVELASGYQMGPDKLFQTCIAWGVNGGKGISMGLAKKAIQVYRKKHEPVVELWGDAERAAIKAVQTGKEQSFNGCVYYRQGPFLRVRLPSGRSISYHGPSVRNEPTPWGDVRPKLYHWRTHSQSKTWVHTATYGGKLVENIVQGTARDICVNGALNASAAGYRFLFQVHDENVDEAPKGHGSVEEFERLVSQLPAWAKGLPIKAKGWTGHRYKKG